MTRGSQPPAVAVFGGTTGAAVPRSARSGSGARLAGLLPDDSLEGLRLLTACDFDRRSPFALILVGQPLLRERLNEPQHYSLVQRIGVRLPASM
jgi:hypothetical protein